HPREHLPSVLEQMPTVSHLDSLRCSQACPFGIGSSPVTTDDFNTWMRPQPIGERVGLAVREQVNHLPLFQVGQKCAIAPTTTHGPVIHTQNARGWSMDK